MKKILIAAMSVLCLAACVQEEIVNAPHSEAIAFSGAFVDTETRADSFTEETLSGFNVWGFMNNPAAPVFNGTEVEKGTQGWSYEGDDRYWIPGQKYYFAALAPMSSENIEVELTTGVDAVQALKTVTFTNKTGNEDLIYSERETTAVESGNQSVSFTFQHLLSKVKFTFANHMRNDYINVKVSNIKMTAPKKASMGLIGENKGWNTPASYGEFNFGSIEVKARDSKSTEDLFMIPASSSYSYVITFDIELVMDSVQEVLYKATKSAVVSGVDLEVGAAYNFSTAINPDILNLETVEFTVNDVKDWNEASDLSKIAIASKLGGEVTLSEDVTSTNVIEVVRDLTIHLNGHTLKYEGDNRLFRVVDGAKLTIYGDDKATSAVVVNSSNLTESTTAAYIATAYAESNIEINGGLHETNGCTLYHANGGKVVINSGKFAATEQGYNPIGKYGHNYTMNIQGTDGQIVVNGGSFYKWDPSQSKGENPVANFVADGLRAVAEGDWFVIKELPKEEVVDNLDDFKTSINNPNIDIISLNSSLNPGNKYTFPTITSSRILNMNNNKISAGGAAREGDNYWYAFYVRGCEVVFNDAYISGGGIQASAGAKIIYNGSHHAVWSTTSRYSFVAVGNSEFIINGGSFSINEKNSCYYAYVDATSILRINSGTFAARLTADKTPFVIISGGQVIITGGTFGFDPTTWVADGYTATQSGSTWTVHPKSE